MMARTISFGCASQRAAKLGALFSTPTPLDIAVHITKQPIEQEMSSVLQHLYCVLLLIGCSGSLAWRDVCVTSSLDHSLFRLRGGNIIHATTLIDVESAIRENPEKLVVIDFTSKNCEPCKKVAPLYEELSVSEEFTDKVVFLKIDVDENPEAVSKYQVTGWPTFIFVKKGEVQTEIVGGKLAEATLYDWVKLLMPKDKDK